MYMTHRTGPAARAILLVSLLAAGCGSADGASQRAHGGTGDIVVGAPWSWAQRGNDIHYGEVLVAETRSSPDRS